MTIKHYESALNEGYWVSKPKAESVINSYPMVLDPTATYQSVSGFGGAFTEASAYNFSLLSSALQSEVLECYFDADKGLGYNLGRIAMNSCDFALGNYTYVDEFDYDLSTFSIERERQWVIPMVLRAQTIAKQPISLLVSPWSPPAWMKTNQQMNHGGKLKEEFYPLWAKYFVRFIDAITKEGLQVSAVTPQNEPAATQVWDSCIYSAEEEGRFVLDYLGPALKNSSHADVNVYIWDHNRDIIVERVQPILSDPRAKDYVHGVAFHWYVSEDFDHLSEVKDLFPDTHLLFTEGCIEGGVRLGAFGSGERYMRNMIGDFANGCEGYIDWNLLLDVQGGPNHVSNYCDAPMICDPQNNQLHINSSYYAIGHFSRFVQVGAKRIKSKWDHPFVHQVAFQNPNGSMVLIVQNETSEAAAFQLQVKGQTEGIELKPHSFSTILIEA